MIEYIKLPFYIILHPFSGFYDMKYGRKGRISHMVISLVLLCVSYSFQNQYAGFAIKQMYPLGFSLLYDCMQIIIMLVLFCVANWSVTCLMSGEGRILDIAMGITYSFLPMILVFIPATLLSNLLTDAEAVFFNTAILVSVIWFIFLAVASLLTVQNFTFLKTLGTLFLTFVAMLIIVFLIGLLVSLLQQLWIFFYGIYIELIYRV
jgi:hypothetical protein